MGVKPEPGFWNRKKVFLTGHTGFKGSWLTLWLSSLGAQVRGYALTPETDPNLFEALGLDRYCDSVIGDIRDLRTLETEISAFSPEIVIHMAAQPLVQFSYKEPVETFETNVMGTAHLLECCRRLPSLRAVINVTTDKVYENSGTRQRYAESDRLGASDPYSASKACSELVSQSYRRSFFDPERYRDHGVAIATARAGNVIGGGDWSGDRLIPDAIRGFVSPRKEVELRNPRSVRPWQHVLEPLSGYLTLAQACYEKGAAFGKAWNFGPSDRQVFEVEQVVQLTARLWGEGVAWKSVVTERIGKEADLLFLDSTLANRELGWESKLDLQSTLRLTVEWYKYFYQEGGSELIDLTHKQIADYGSS